MRCTRHVNLRRCIATITEFRPPIRMAVLRYTKLCPSRQDQNKGNYLIAT